LGLFDNNFFNDYTVYRPIRFYQLNISLISDSIFAKGIVINEYRLDIWSQRPYRLKLDEIFCMTIPGRSIINKKRGGYIQTISHLVVQWTKPREACVIFLSSLRRQW